MFPAFDRYNRVAGYKECRIHENDAKTEIVTTNYPKFVHLFISIVYISSIVYGITIINVGDLQCQLI